MPTCPRCKIRLPRSAAYCLECGAVIRHPRVRLTGSDNRRLGALVRALSDRDASARALAAKLDQAEIVPDRDIEPDVVTLDSRIAYRLGASGDIHRRTLVVPAHYVPGGQWLSVLSPLGTTLLGMRAGDDMPYRDHAGTPLPVSLLDVEWQPGAQAGRTLADRAPAPPDRTAIGSVHPIA